MGAGAGAPVVYARRESEPPGRPWEVRGNKMMSRASVALPVTREMQMSEAENTPQQAEEQLRLQSAALQAADNTILITDRAGKIIWVNAAFTQHTGYSFEE